MILFKIMFCKLTFLPLLSLHTLKLFYITCILRPSTVLRNKTLAMRNSRLIDRSILWSAFLPWFTCLKSFQWWVCSLVFTVDRISEKCKQHGRSFRITVVVKRICDFRALQNAHCYSISQLFLWLYVYLIHCFID